MKKYRYGEFNEQTQDEKSAPSLRLSDNQPHVKCFNEDKLKIELKNSPKIIRDYVRVLRDCLDRQQELTNIAIKKIKEISKK